MVRIVACVGLCSVALLNASAQDPVTVDSHMVRVEYEDAHIRVLRMHYAPHQSLPMHDHPARAGVCVTACDTSLIAPGGSVSVVKTPAGQWFWTEPTRHAVRNNSDQPMETIEIEFRKAASPAAPIPITATPAPPEPVPVDAEPFHHPVYENQYVRILDVRFQPGQTTLVHTHGHDYVAVHLSDATVQSQPEGKDWSPVPVHFGEVQMNWLNGKPYTHRVRNTGTTPFHVMVFELLP